MNVPSGKKLKKKKYINLCSTSKIFPHRFFFEKLMRYNIENFRLATALARLRIVDTVEKEDVNEAMRLMEMSKDSLALGIEDRPGKTKSVIDRIYDAIREMVPTGGQGTLKISEIRERCTSKGFKPDQIEETISEYERLNIFNVNETRTKITFVDAH